MPHGPEVGRVIRAVVSLLAHPLQKRMKPVLAAAGRWAGLLFVVFMSGTTGAVIALAVVGNSPLAPGWP